MVNTCAVDAKTYKSSTAGYPYNVPGSVFDWVFLGAETMYCVHTSVPSDGMCDML